MKIAISQKRLYMNNIDKNYKMIEASVLEAKDRADLLVFSELALTNHIFGQRLIDSKTLIDYHDKVIELSHKIPIVWGHYDDDLKSSIYYAKDGKVVEYGDEYHPFRIELQDMVLVVSMNKVKTHNFNLVIGLNEVAFDKEEPIYENTLILGAQGIYNNGHEVYVLNDSGYVSHGDKLYALESDFEIIDLGHLDNKPLKVKSKLDVLLEGIKYFDDEYLAYGPKWIVGVSGGLDSSVTLALLVMALGKERVHGVTMPSEFTRELTLKNAHHLFEVLNISHEEIDIMDMVNATVDSLEYERIEGLAYENIQARLRGHTLMSVSSLINGVISNNGNKIETALGYATLYGDAIGALSLLGDVNKLEVGMLAEAINQRFSKEVIPKNLIPKLDEHDVIWDFAPSAELAKDQFDPMKWGYHDLLVEYLMQNSIESYLEKYLDGTLFEMEVGKYLSVYRLSDDEFISDLEWVYRQLSIATYKRIQIPPVLKLYSYGFSPEAQVPIVYSERYMELKSKVLKKERFD